LVLTQPPRSQEELSRYLRKDSVQGLTAVRQ